MQHASVKSNLYEDLFYKKMFDQHPENNSSRANYSSESSLQITIEKNDSSIKINFANCSEITKNTKFGTGIPLLDNRQLFQPEDYFEEIKNLILPRDQINNLRKFMGLNISEIAEILHTTRTTIYEWLNSENSNLRHNNQERLNQMHEICLYWKEKNLGHLSGYTHKIIREGQSLFHLLTTDIINQQIIYNALESIANTIVSMRQQELQREQNLRTKGFKEISKKERKNNLDRFIQDMS